MKNIIFVLAFIFSSLSFADTQVRVATFDSGFGGFFTAKEIEKQSRDLNRTHAAQFSISHYGDTANAPYGEKTPERIAELSAQGINRAFNDGAEVVFIACNTASTQFAAIKTLLNKKHPGRGDNIVSIIDSSVTELKRLIDVKLKTQKVVHAAILATPATIRAGAYVRAIAAAYKTEAVSSPLQTITQDRWYKVKGAQVDSVTAKVSLALPQGKTIYLHQMGPGNWVDMIEHGASASEKTNAIKRDLTLLSTKASWDVVGEFCTHFPAIDPIIKQESKLLGLSTDETAYIKQGPLMAGIYRKMMMAKLAPRTTPATATRDIRAQIFISGTNLQETANLSKELFPKDPAPAIRMTSFILHK